MDYVTLQNWIDALGRAWETRDAQAAASLFSAAVIYQEDPFEAPLHGKAAVFDYWQTGTRDQADIHFKSSIIALSAATGVINWHTTFIRPSTGQPVELDGVLVASFDQAGLCKHLREWWRSNEISN